MRGIALIETFLRPMSWAEMPAQAAELFGGYRSPRGEEMVLENNMFIEVNLVRGLLRGLAKSDHDVYRAPYIVPASRKPMLAWAREYPLDGEPADVVEVVQRYGRWMAETPDVPKLLMAVENGNRLGLARGDQLGRGDLRQRRGRVGRAGRAPDAGGPARGDRHGHRALAAPARADDGVWRTFVSMEEARRAWWRGPSTATRRPWRR